MLTALVHRQFRKNSSRRGACFPISFMPLTCTLMCLSTIGCSTGINPTASIPSTGPSTSRIAWTPPQIGSINQLGTINDSADNAVLLRPAITAINGQSLTLTTSSWNTAKTALTLSYSYPGGTLHVNATYTTSGGALNLNLDADQHIVASVDVGSFDSQLQLQPIAVPYYSGNIGYAKSISQYVNAWWDWQSSNATKLPATAAQYQPKTNGTLNLLHEQLHVIISPKIIDTFPTIPNPPSPYKPQMAGRLILDSWDASFAATQQGLADLSDYGITNCALIIHNWQHFGYDNALPQHYSANPALGGDDALLAAVQSAKSMGCLTALHQNFTDYYPNYPAFTQASLALDTNSSPINSWLNPSTNIQSFETKPGWMVSNAQTQSPLIHQRYGTDASYVDVNSGVTPDERSDMDDKVPAAATLGLWLTNAAALWTFERQSNAGPVFGEGANHWYYSGLLDGAEAQLGAGQTAMNLGESLPLFVDFDLLHIHPLQVNHGMGYYERWSKNGSAKLSTLESDAYRMQEIAYGHAPFLGRSTWSNVPRAILESGLLAPVATAYGSAQATNIQYNSAAGWVDTSTAARASNLAQVQITYDNGLIIAANAATTSLVWDGLTLPQYGWSAKGADVLAYTAQCGNTLCDYSETATSLFANARNQFDARLGWNYATPSVAAFTQPATNNLAITYNWQVLRPLNPSINYLTFVHFVDDSAITSTNEGIVFQGDHLPTTTTPQWRAGTTATDGPITTQLPNSIADGTYSIRIGLYDPATGARLPLAGTSDSTGRIIVGYITIANSGSRITFAPPSPQPDDPRLNAAGSLVDFGKIKTDGMVSIQQVAGNWVLRTFPRTRNVTVYLDKSAFPMPAVIHSDATLLTPIGSQTYWQVPTDGAKSYTWPAR